MNKSTRSKMTNKSALTNTNMLTSSSGYIDTTLQQQHQQRTLTNRCSQWHLNLPCQGRWVCVCVCAWICVCVCGDRQIKGACAASFGAGRNLWRGPLGCISERLMDRPNAYWWASLMLMAVMSHNACQQHGEDREPFNLLIPSGIDDTVIPLETNMTDIAWLKCNNNV